MPVPNYVIVTGSIPCKQQTKDSLVPACKATLTITAGPAYVAWRAGTIADLSRLSPKVGTKTVVTGHSSRLMSLSFNTQLNLLKTKQTKIQEQCTIFADNNFF
jgi:hypothetical protein